MTTFWPESFHRRRVRGFTLVELIVAMGVTTIILTLLVSITGVALDGWRLSRNKVRAARQAKEAINQISKDLESLVVRSGNNYEWFYAGSDSADDPRGGDAALLAFYTVATDRYDGDAANNPGDICAVGYRLVYKDPVSGSNTSNFAVFSLYRNLVDPNATFTDVLASPLLIGSQTQSGAFDDFVDTGDGQDKIDNISNYICENIYEMSVGVVIEYTESDAGTTVTKHRRFTVVNQGGASADEEIDELRVRGNGISADPISPSVATEIANGRVVSVDVALTVITDHGMGVLRNNQGLTGAGLEDFLEKNSYRYTKSILLPQS